LKEFIKKLKRLMGPEPEVLIRDLRGLTISVDEVAYYFLEIRVLIERSLIILNDQNIFL
jgi:hypothetical protein